MTFITHGFWVSVISDVWERVRHLASPLRFMLRRCKISWFSGKSCAVTIPRTIPYVEINSTTKFAVECNEGLIMTLNSNMQASVTALWYKMCTMYSPKSVTLYQWPMWAFAITWHPLSVSFSHFNLFLLGKDDSLKNGIQVLKDFSWEKLEKS
jgi:hypothetical protein